MSRHVRSRLGLESLEGRDVPAFLTGAEIVAAGDVGGPPVVRLLDPASGAVRSQFLAYEASFIGGVRVAVGDVNGDGFPDLVTGTGAGGGPAVKVYSGFDGGILSSFFAYAPSFTGGINVAAGDVDGDGRDEVIVGAGAGGGPQIAVFDGVTGSQEATGFAYDDAFRGGVYVGAGDTDGDGFDEIVTGTGASGGPDVRIFDVSFSGLVQIGGFFAYAPSFVGGVPVAVGDINGDPFAEIITGTGSGGGPQVGVFAANGQQLVSFFAYDGEFRNGVNVGAADLTGDGIVEVLTGAGPGGGAQVNVYSLPGTDPIISLTGLPDDVAGVLVAGSPITMNLPSVSDGVIDDAYDTAEEVVEELNAALLAAQQQQVLLVPFPFPVPFGGFGGFGNPFFPFGGFGGLGLGFGFPLGADPFFGGGGGGVPCFTCSDSAFFDPGFSDPAFGGGFFDPGFGGGFVDPGFGGGFVDPGFVDPGFGGGFSDPGFGGGFSDPGFGGGFGGGFF